MNQVNCALCGQDDWDVRYPSTLVDENGFNPEAFRCTSNFYGHHPQIVQCCSCSHIFVNPRWSDTELYEAYSGVEDLVYEEEREGRELTFRKHLQDMEKSIGPSKGRKLLDVGAYIGVFVEAALTSGWEAAGIEPSRWAVSVAKQQDLPVEQGTLDDVLKTGKKYDVITLWDVIEHVAEPKMEVEKTIQLLNPGGYIVIHTMDVESRIARLMGAKWPWLMDMHLHYFSQRTMARTLVEVGYDVIGTGAKGRYLRLGYLASRVKGINSGLGRLSTAAANKLGVSETAIPVNFGDLFTMYARKPDPPPFQK